MIVDTRIGSWLLPGLLGLAMAQPARCGFRVPPYLQHVTSDAASIVWWSPDAVAGTLESGPTARYGSTIAAAPVRSEVISTVTNGREDATDHPYRHEVRLMRLQTDTIYHYRVTQGSETWAARFTTAVGLQTDFEFAVAADPESKATEPLRNEIHRAVLNLLRRRSPRFLVYAGDLVDQGNAQDDWDSFWSDVLRPSPVASLASTIPIYAALGNHDYDGLNSTLGGNRTPYAQPHAEAGVAKYRAYFTFPPSDHLPESPQHERYYRFKYGPVTVIVLDTNNDSLSTDEPDTNWDAGRYAQHALTGENEAAEAGGRSFAPDIHGGEGVEDSRQYRWLVRALRRASTDSAFIFVVNHQAPYSSFVHGDPHDRQSGYPLRKLDPLFHRYAVTAVFSGHDESYERSVTTSDGEVHYYVLPTIGDPTGLRTPLQNPAWQQSYRRFIYPPNRRRHGYLAVRIEYRGSNEYRATLTPYFYDPADPTNADLFYDDVVRLTRRLPGR